jgi:hypothetical protein
MNAMKWQQKICSEERSLKNSFKSTVAGQLEFQLIKTG